MKTPPFLMAGALVFWGWQCQWFVLGVLTALILEGSRLVRTRLALSPSDFSRLTDLCTLLFLGAAVYLYLTRSSVGAILILFQWTPLILLPLILAQVYSTSDRIDISALFLIFWRKSQAGNHGEPTLVNLTYPYFAIVMLSASAANNRTPWFYIGLFILCGWALWNVRSRGFSPIVWLLLLAFAGLLGYAAHTGLNRLQGTLENRFTAWFSNYIREDADPFRARTAIGAVMDLKLSDRILFRVYPGKQVPPPLLLRDGSFNFYRSALWLAVPGKFFDVRAEDDDSTWILNADSPTNRAIRITAATSQGKGLLSLPHGTAVITHLPVARLLKHPFSIYKVQGAPGLIQYTAKYNPGMSYDAPPDHKDLLIPDEDRPILEWILGRLKNDSETPAQTLSLINRFFTKNFTYSLEGIGEKESVSPLEYFFTRSRSGHCEYFATATVLLLRAAGIPARYATGYMVHEYSPWENCYLIRARHAHAWTLVYEGGRWRDFDTTPASWIDIEEEGSSVWTPVSDLWSWCVFKFQSWRWAEKKGERKFRKWVGWFLIPLFLVLIGRFYSRKRVRRKAEKGIRQGAGGVPGGDSPFYRIEKALVAAGHRRYPGEPLSKWIHRINDTEGKVTARESLEPLLALHYGYRFDPAGLDDQRREALEKGVRQWLDEQERGH